MVVPVSTMAVGIMGLAYCGGTKVVVVYNKGLL